MAGKLLDETGLVTLWELIKSEDEAAIAAGVKTVTGTYKGGSGSSVTVTLGFKPKFVMISRGKENINSGACMIAIIIDRCCMEVQLSAANRPSSIASITNNGFSVSSSSSDRYGMNYTGDTYYYIAIK